MLGATPYPDMTTRAVSLEVMRGGHPARPPSMPEMTSSIMHRCWAWDKQERPKFATLCQELSRLLAETQEMVPLRRDLGLTVTQAQARREHRRSTTRSHYYTRVPGESDTAASK